MIHQDMKREATLGPIETDEDHHDRFREAEMDLAIDELNNVVTLIHIQEVMIEGTEGIDPLAETIIGDKDKTGDTHLGQDLPRIPDTDHLLTPFSGLGPELETFS